MPEAKLELVIWNASSPHYRSSRAAAGIGSCSLRGAGLWPLLNFAHVSVVHSADLCVIPRDRHGIPACFSNGAAISGIASPVDADRLPESFGFVDYLSTINPNIMSAEKKQSPRNSPTDGSGMACRSREESFMRLNVRHTINVPARYCLKPLTVPSPICAGAYFREGGA